MWCQLCNLEQALLFWLNNSERQILQESNLQSLGNKSAMELNRSAFTTVDYLSLIKSVLSKSPLSMAQYIDTDKNIYKPQAYPRPIWCHFLNWFITSIFKGEICNKQSYTWVTVIKLSLQRKKDHFHWPDNTKEWRKHQLDPTWKRSKKPPKPI